MTEDTTQLDFELDSVPDCNYSEYEGCSPPQNKHTFMNNKETMSEMMEKSGHERCRYPRTKEILWVTKAALPCGKSITHSPRATLMSSAWSD